MIFISILLVVKNGRLYLLRPEWPVSLELIVLICPFGLEWKRTLESDVTGREFARSLSKIYANDIIFKNNQIIDNARRESCILNIIFSGYFMRRIHDLNNCEKQHLFWFNVLLVSVVIIERVRYFETNVDV